jgi:hypothetical protein
MVTASPPYGSGMEALDYILPPQSSLSYELICWMVFPCMWSTALLSTSSLIWLDCWSPAGVCGLVIMMYVLTLTWNLGWHVWIPLTCRVTVVILHYKMHHLPHLLIKEATQNQLQEIYSCFLTSLLCSLSVLNYKCMVFLYCNWVDLIQTLVILNPLEIL